MNPDIAEDKSRGVRANLQASGMSICISASNVEDLLKQLQGIDISVPPRSEGRDTREHVEPAIACHLVATLAGASLIAFPFTLNKRDRDRSPDFLMTLGDTRVVGLEVTEAIPPTWGKFAALRDREFPDELIEPGHFRFGECPPDTARMRELLQERRFTARPYVGNEMEQEWAQFVLQAIKRKLAKLANEEFAKFDENWLAIYGNVPLSANADAVRRLPPLVDEVWTMVPRFDTIFVECGGRILKLTESGLRQFDLNNLWT